MILISAVSFGREWVHRAISPVAGAPNQARGTRAPLPSPRWTRTGHQRKKYSRLPGKPKPGPGHGPPETSDSDILCPYAWGAPVHKLNCETVWPAELDEPETEGRAPRRDYLELDTPKYAGSIEKKWIVEKLLAQAGVRLAGILNRIFSQQ